jgi:hypothetical protein
LYIVNDVNINKLPEDDVPECLWTTMEISENVIDAETERVGFTSDPLADAAERGEQNATNSLPLSTR